MSFRFGRHFLGPLAIYLISHRRRPILSVAPNREKGAGRNLTRPVPDITRVSFFS